MKNPISNINDLFFIFNSFILCLIIHNSIWIYKLCLHGGFGKSKPTRVINKKQRNKVK